MNECLINNGNCSQSCINTNGSYICSCDLGYTLGADRFTCNGKVKWNIHLSPCIVTCIYYVCCLKDIDECSMFNGNCSQVCINKMGSYGCSCQSGYQLATNNRTCDGEFMNIIQIRITFDCSRFQ